MLAVTRDQMRLPPALPSLAHWQQDFVNKFLRQQSAKSLLVAQAGTGKTVTSLVAAWEMVERGIVDSGLVISDRMVVRDQWRQVAGRYGLDLADTLESELGRHWSRTTIR